MANGKIITSVSDALAISSNIIESVNTEVVYISPPSLLVLGSQLGLRENIKMLLRKEATVWGIADFSYQYIEEMRELLDIGTDLRHISQYQGISMLEGTDARTSVR